MSLIHSAMAAMAALPLLVMATGTAVAALTPCEHAGMEAERTFGLPNGLLLAIGRVESGRLDRATGRIVPWPWAINLAGAGQLAETKEAAIRIATEALARGHRNVDVGCFQVNLLHHPTAFTTLDEAFDPSANAHYAARFLVDLKGRVGSWTAAIESYHSANPARGIPYGRAVMGKWAEAASVGMVNQQGSSFGMRIWTPSAPGTAPSIIKIETRPAGR